MSDRLPNSSEAQIEQAKIVCYLLSREHPEGGSKAKFFLRCGFTVQDWEGMADALRHHARSNPVVRTVEFPYGRKYTLDCAVPTPDKRNPCIRTVWEIRSGDSRPRLLTAYPQR